MIFNIEHLTPFLDSLTTNDAAFNVRRDAERDGITVSLFVKEHTSNNDLLLETVVDRITNMRDKLLDTKLFSEVKRDLTEYDKLKNMKFVLEELLKLDLDTIAKTKEKKVDSFLSKNSQINSYLGRK